MVAWFLIAAVQGAQTPVMPAPLTPTPLAPTPGPAPELAAAAPAPSPVGRRSLSVLAMAGASAAPSDSIVASGRGAVELGIREPWGLALEGGAESPRNPQFASGLMLNARLMWIGLEGRYAFFFRGSGDLCFITGLRLELLSMRVVAAPMLEDFSVPGVTAAATAAVEYRHELGEGLFLVARIGAQLRPGALSYNFFVQNPVQHTSSENFSIPPWGFTLNLGLGWRALF